MIETALRLSKDYEKVTDSKIKENRIGEFNLEFEGNLPENFEVEYRLIRNDFDFGCNIFMLDQYDSEEENKRYLDLWKKIFNTAVVPFYWEGTEPKQGLLRYSDNNGMDVYRRPCADKVLKYLKENKIKPKGHPLFWHEFIPNWLPSEWDKLLPLIEKRFSEISERYGKEIQTFDLLNEPSRIWDMTFEHKNDGYKMVVPPKGYIDDIFDLGEKYFSNNTLILNDTVGASFTDFRGIYGGYYQLLEKLISAGRRVDRIGLQCHTYDDDCFKNVFFADRLDSLLSIYKDLGRKTVISEISIPSDIGEELQAMAVKQLYKVAFSNKGTEGIFWWNLDDNGITTFKNRNALGENLPSAGIVTNGVPKQSYKVLDELINKEWHTFGKTSASNGKAEFCGFYGTYEITVKGEGIQKTVETQFLTNLGKKQGAKITL